MRNGDHTFALHDTYMVPPESVPISALGKFDQTWFRCLGRRPPALRRALRRVRRLRASGGSSCAPIPTARI